MTVSDLAANAGVSRPSVYRRWAGKLDLAVDAHGCDPHTREGGGAPKDTAPHTARGIPEGRTPPQPPLRRPERLRPGRPCHNGDGEMVGTAAQLREHGAHALPRRIRATGWALHAPPPAGHRHE